MNRSHPLQLSLRGKRDYLHGTDLYQSIVRQLGSAHSDRPFSMTFHTRLLRQPDLVVAPDDIQACRSRSDFRGEIKTGSGPETVHAVLLESGREVTLRRPCNEPDVTAAALIDHQNRSATFATETSSSTIEQVVFLNKHLHVHLLSEVDGSWLFARLDLLSPLPAPDPARLRIQMVQVLGGRFTRSEVFWDDRKIGSIYFSLAS